MPVTALPSLVYSLACLYLAIVGVVGFTTNGIVMFIYWKVKRVSSDAVVRAKTK